MPPPGSPDSSEVSDDLTDFMSDLADLQPVENPNQNKQKPSKSTDSEDEKLFGTDNEDESQPTDGILDGLDAQNETHKLKFDFISRVQFIDKYKDLKIQGAKNTGLKAPTGEPYMEVEYHTQFEANIVLGKTRSIEKVDADFDSQHWGSLARNEYFDCRLDITIPQIPVELTTKIIEVIPEGEAEPTSQQLAIKVDFGTGLKEDWFSLCTDISGDTLNTKGDTQEYNLQSLKMVEPVLSALLVEDYDPTAKTKIDLSIPSKVVPDDEIQNDITFSGEGSVTIDPL